jgi:hypothetical protein
MTDRQKRTIECADSWLKSEGLPTYTELSQKLTNIMLNAVLIPDPRMNGMTDCYAVPLDDVEAI